MLNVLSTLIITWAITYFLHSSFLLGVATILDRIVLLKSHSRAEFIWRIALFGGLVTSSLQLLFLPLNEAAHTPMQTAIQTTIRAKADTKADTQMTSTQVPSMNKQTAEEESPNPELALLLPLNSPLPAQLSDVNPQAIEKPRAQASTAIAIELSQNAALATAYLSWIWIVIASIAALGTWRAARRLNRLAADFPRIHTQDLQRLLNESEQAKLAQINLRISENWNSPFVTPDYTICIPRWTTTSLNGQQLRAMLAHEIAHITRRDPSWRIAMQLLSRVLFFQPLHWIAIRKLSMLAELACDESAAYESGQPQALAEAIYACAKMHQTQKIPSLALAISRAESPLLNRINSLINFKFETHQPRTKHRTRPLSEWSATAFAMLALICILPAIVLKITPGEIGAALAATQEKVGLSSLITPQLSKDTVRAPAQTIASVAARGKVQSGNFTSPLQQHHTASKFDAKELLASHFDGQQSNIDLSILAPAVADQRPQAIAAMGEQISEEQSAKRAQFKTQIAHYTQTLSAKDLKIAPLACRRPYFKDAATNLEELTDMINAVNDFAQCFNRYGEQLSALQKIEQLVPTELLQIMNQDELKKTQQRASRVLASLRMAANMLVDEFEQEKFTWEQHTRDYFRNVQTRDWSTLRRLSVIPNSSNEEPLIRAPQLVKLDTEVELEFRLIYN